MMYGGALRTRRIRLREECGEGVTVLRGCWVWWGSGERLVFVGVGVVVVGVVVWLMGVGVISPWTHHQIIIWTFSLLSGCYLAIIFWVLRDASNLLISGGNGTC